MQALSHVMDGFLETIGREPGRHWLQAETPQDLDAFERTVGFPLPSDFRKLLTASGAGILYESHELFGALRVMTHDIELVPDSLSVKRRLDPEGALPAWLLPFHRDGEAVHLLDLRDGSVVQWRGADHHPSLASFLSGMVMPAAPA